MSGRSPRTGRTRRCAAATLSAAIAALTLASASATAAAPTYGVVPQDGALPSAEDIALMPPGGVETMRLMAHWPDIEPNEGAFYDWSGLDWMVRETTNRGVQPFLFLYGTPAWLAREDGQNCGSSCSVYAPDSPSTRRAFAEFAAAAVRRYGPGGDFWEAPVQTPAKPPATMSTSAFRLIDPCLPLPDVPCPPPPPPPPDPPPTDPTQPPCQCTVAHPIRNWQIWNEQNSPKYFAPGADVGKYASLLKAAGDAIHQVDPGADVVMGGMWGPRSAKKVVVPLRDYLNTLYEIDGIEESFDSIAIHPYSKDVKGAVSQLETARKVAKKNGDRGVGLWVTELGWAAKGPKGDPYVKGLQGQARMLSKALRAFERRQRHFRLRGVFWYSWRDRPGGQSICSWCGNAGLRAEDGSAKPAWRAFTRVATR